ncbi:MAG: phosphotransferase family protein [Acidimicrobiales bacterium]
MASLLSPEDRAWAGRALGGRIVSTRRLKGGISAQTVLVVAQRRDGSRRRAVVRRLSDDWIAAEPDIVTREATLLDELEGRAVPAPKHVAHDPSGALLMTFEPGRAVHHPKDATTFTRRLVEALVHVHAGGPPRSPGHRDQGARLDAHVREESPRRNGVDVDPLLWSHVRRLWPSIERRSPTLIHDDYHPGNVLWQRDRITAIVDWTVPGIGQPAADACYLALDVSLVRGLDAGDAMLAAYEAAMGEPVPDRPFWQLLSATRAVGIADAWYASWVDVGVPGLTQPLVDERLAAFVARALAEL